MKQTTFEISFLANFIAKKTQQDRAVVVCFHAHIVGHCPVQCVGGGPLRGLHAWELYQVIQTLVTPLLSGLVLFELAASF